MPSAKQIQELLKLRPLPVEGGYYAETYRSKFALARQALPSGYPGERALSTAIYYMLTPDTFSAIHRLKGDEVYHFYLGDPAEMLVLKPDGGKFALMGTTMSPGFDPADFDVATRDELSTRYPDYAALIAILTHTSRERV